METLKSAWSLEMTERSTDFIDKLNEQLQDQVTVLQNWQGRGVDPLLQWLVKVTNETNTRYVVTLTVGGNLVSGTLISLNEYLEEWSGLIAAQIGHKDSADAVRQEVVGWKKPENEEQPTPQLIHLKDAEVFTSNGMPIAPGGSLWRGKISSVDGFNLGRLVAERKN